MKKNLLFLFLIFTTFEFYSQIVVITQNTTDPNSCNGSACLDSSAIANISATTVFWGNGGAVIQQGGYCAYNLCPGTYTVTYNYNGNTMTSTFTIGAGSGNPCNGLSAALNIQAAQDAASCDGMATCAVTGGSAPYTFSWSNGAFSTTAMASNLCAGTYICCTVADANGCTVTTCDSVSSFSGPPNGGGGDTLIISGSGCNNPVGNITISIEDCQFNYNAVDTAFLSTVTLGANPADSTTMLWVFIDTNGVSTTIATFAPQFNTTGCYNVTLILFCSQKSMNIKTIIVDAQYTYQSAGIELIQNETKKIVKVFDLTGREVTPCTGNGILIYQYDDGSIEKVMVTKN